MFVIAVQALVVCGPALGREHGVLDIAIEVEGIDPAFAADPGLAVATERCAKITNEAEAIDPDCSGIVR